jgi:hypothetical protein
MCNLSKRGAEASLSQRVLRLRSLTFFASGIGLTSTIAGCSFASTMAWDGEQYEEVIALYTGTMWRDAAAVFLQPLIGPVAKALESLGAGEEAIGVCGVLGWWFFAQQNDVVLSWSRAAIASCA